MLVIAAVPSLRREGDAFPGEAKHVLHGDSDEVSFIENSAALFFSFFIVIDTSVRERSHVLPHPLPASS